MIKESLLHLRVKDERNIEILLNVVMFFNFVDEEMYVEVRESFFFR